MPHRALALVRAAALSAWSYKLSTAFSLVGILVSILPLYFVSGALQSVVEESIRTEGGEYFGFLIIGIASSYVVAAAVNAIPGAIGQGLGNGTLEALFSTRASVVSLLFGMSGYAILFAWVQATVILLGGSIGGVALVWWKLPLTVPIILLLVGAYAGIGLLCAALILAFRTAGPLATIVIAGSSLLGGVYYSTSVIPSWIQLLSGVVPLTYGLRMIRRLLLASEGTALVLSDLWILAAMAAASLALGATCFGAALRRARRSGTLAQY